MGELSAQAICKAFGEKQVLDRVSFTLREGEIVALLGVSGVGKSTLFHILAGLSSPDSGAVLLNGEEVTGKAGRVSYMQQKDLLLPHKKIVDNVTLPLVLGGMKKSEARAIGRQKLEEFGLAGTAEKYPAQLSGGMRQRAAFLRTCLFGGEADLLDEPFSALDAITKRQMHVWFLERMEQLRHSVMFITHDVDEAIFLADRVLILAGRPGRIALELPVEAPRPRDTLFTASERFMEVKRRVLSALSQPEIA